MVNLRSLKWTLPLSHKKHHFFVALPKNPYGCCGSSHVSLVPLLPNVGPNLSHTIHMMLVQDGTQPAGSIPPGPWRLESCLQTCERLLFIARRQQQWNLAVKLQWQRQAVAPETRKNPEMCVVICFCYGVWKCKHPSKTSQNLYNTQTLTIIICSVLLTV